MELKELLQKMPDWIYLKKSSFGRGYWIVADMPEHVRTPKGFNKYFECDSPEGALAAMYKYLIEKNLL